MKRSVMSLSICLFMCATIANAQNQNRDWASLGHYASDNEKIEAPTRGENRVVFMGNSITEGWVRLHPDFFTLNSYIGRGISGQTSFQFLLRFREDVINLRPKVVIINAGTNDIAENTGTYHQSYTFGNIVSMVELAQANGIKVILSSVLPAVTFSWNPQIKDGPEKISALNAKIKEYARTRKIPYIDYYTTMVSGSNGALNPQYTKDGVHPTLEGYEVMESIVKPILDKCLKK